MTAFVKDLHRKPVQSVIEIHTPGCTVNTNNAIQRIILLCRILLF